MPDLTQSLLAVSRQRNALWALLVDIETACANCRISDLREQVAELTARRSEIVPGHEQKKGEPVGTDSPREAVMVKTVIELDDHTAMALSRAFARARRRIGKTEL